MRTLKTTLILVVASAVYGFAAGSVHSLLFASRNLIKFPLLIVVTTVVCSLAHFLLARFAGLTLPFGEVQTTVLRIFRSLSVLLASASPVVYFLAMTIEQPRSAHDLREYPMFLGFNVLLVAVCGSVALWSQARVLLQGSRLTKARVWSIIAAWLLLSLFVGAQWAWYLRPFFGVSALEEDTPFCLGTAPDFRGATSFYESVYQIFDPPTG